MKHRVASLRQQSYLLSVDGYAEKTEQNLIVRTVKSEAEVTNNKRLKYCIVKATTDRHIRAGD